MLRIIIDGTEVAVQWQDMGTHNRITVYKENVPLGHRDVPLLVGTEIAVTEYYAKSILRGHDAKAIEL